MGGGGGGRGTWWEQGESLMSVHIVKTIGTLKKGDQLLRCHIL